LLADAIDRRRLMMFTQGGELVVSAGLAFMSWYGLVTPAVLYIASVFLAIFSSLETPSRQALVPNLVPREHLTSALAVHGAQRSFGAIAGPAVAGILLGFTDAGWCYGLSGVAGRCGRDEQPEGRSAGGRLGAGRTGSLRRLHCRFRALDRLLAVLDHAGWRGDRRYPGRGHAWDCGPATDARFVTRPGIL